MIKVYLKVLGGGELQREHISAWLYGKLSKKYHDDGVETYFNGSSVKAHTFYFQYNKKLSLGDLECIEIRGISVIESKFLRELIVGEKVYLGKVKAEVYLVEDFLYVSKKVYSIKTPLIMRYSSRDLDIDEGYPTIVPSVDKSEWERAVISSITNRANKIYGTIDSDLRGIEVFNEKEVRAQLNIKGQKMVYRSIVGSLVIDGDDFWHEFIQRVGLGNRNTYGYGIIG